MEYRSRASFLGLPLLHIAVGSATPGGQYRRGIATGWIAIGDIARGVLVACGGVAVGGICVGGVALGAISFSGLAVGALAFGGCALGFCAVGGAAFAWYAAVGGLAIARDYAVGGFAKAAHVITPRPGEPFPLSSIPHPPFRTTDAIIFVVLVVAILIFAMTMRQRSQE